MSELKSPVYIAGPMTGVGDNFNHPAFNAVAAKLRGQGYTVHNPAETDGGDTSGPWEYYMRKAITELVKCESVVVLSGWTQSRGAKLEVEIAHQLRLPVIHELNI